ncbi:unnamed protein product [Darwinula stevensoni]|uniref:Uncharacterized protein n=1 Tax=Darwinula stevensoni TaxID=69355 RepID=A0A7R8X516_9CRUS|nr:unnamed protein product [Darwinula stevensoni]CAG0886659.1 unnamed protein product [Darwinula stevensoni]
MEVPLTVIQVSCDAMSLCQHLCKCNCVNVQRSVEVPDILTARHAVTWTNGKEHYINSTSNFIKEEEEVRGQSVPDFAYCHQVSGLGSPGLRRIRLEPEPVPWWLKPEGKIRNGKDEIGEWACDGWSPSNPFRFHCATRVQKKMDHSDLVDSRKEKILKKNIEIRTSLEAVQNAFKEIHPGEKTPDEKTIEGVIDAFFKSGSAAEMRSSSDGDDSRVEKYYMSVAETEHEEYLQENRKEFCNWITSKLKEDKKFLDRAFFTHSADFYLDGKVRRENVRFYGVKDPDGQSQDGQNEDALSQDIQSPKTVSSERGWSKPCGQNCFLCPRMEGRNGHEIQMKGKDGKLETHEIVALGTANCESQYVIYCITCNICGHQYIGLTTDVLKTRMGQHKIKIAPGAPKRENMSAEAMETESKKRKMDGQKHEAAAEGDGKTRKESTSKEHEENFRDMETITTKDGVTARTSISEGHEENMEKKKVVQGIPNHMKKCMANSSKRWESLNVTILHVTLADSKTNLEKLESYYIEKYDPAINMYKKK